MITKIFYSLVLFPNLQYDSIIFGYSLHNIRETNLGEITITFIKGNTSTSLIFTHIDFVGSIEGFQTKNWIISGGDPILVSEVAMRVLKNEVPDFHFFKSKAFTDPIPFGTVLTITSRCNLFCDYCFNDYDYPLKERNLRKGLGLQEYKTIVDILYTAGTRDIIITGGEPFSAPFLWELLAYIRDKGIFIRINTNGTLLFDSILYRLDREFSLNLMVSMHEFNNKDYFEINRVGAKNTQGISGLKGFENKFEQKVIQLKKIRNFRNITLDFLTILTPKNIIYLEYLYTFVLENFHLENWHFFRLYSTGTTKGITREMIALAIHKLYKLNKKYSVSFKIVDSVPFCVTKNIDIASQVIDGELSPHHNVKTIITTDGNIQIMSAFDSHLGSIFTNDLSDVWKGEFVQRMLNQGFLPTECGDCVYKESCRGGSRMDAHIFHGDYGAIDPLARIENKVI